MNKKFIDTLFGFASLFVLIFATVGVICGAIQFGQNEQQKEPMYKEVCKSEDVEPSENENGIVAVCFDRVSAERQVEAEYIARTVWGEARGCSITEQAAVIWCILNRVDSDDPYYPDDVIGVITQKNQFAGYDLGNPVEEEFYNLAVDVFDRWEAEKEGAENVGRVLPKEYLFFHGDGKHNYFRMSYVNDGEYWDFSLESPYDI